ncbi:peptidoglycan bridge formation glycyltransferase FemA/FemB family protein [Facklamia sp. P13064]|uniref:peptidoglycan bridge formation glycyltransferase FemA/FemB family protein n=1 Tax=unclassified Facklamia TaxID=2622293 RepID=UPI003D16EC39
MKIIEISYDELAHFLANKSGFSFLQTAQMAKVLVARGFQEKRLALENAGVIKAVGLAYSQKVFAGKRMELMAGTFAAEEQYESLFYQHLKLYAKRMKITEVIVQPNHKDHLYNSEATAIKDLEAIPSYFDELGYTREKSNVYNMQGMPTFQYLKDLSAFTSEDEKLLLKSFNKNSQRKIKKAKQFGLSIRTMDYEEMEDFCRITRETAQRQDFGDKSLDYYQAMYKNFKDQVEFLVAEINLPKAIEKLKRQINELNPKKVQDQDRIKSLEKDIEMVQAIQDEEKKEIIPLANMLIVYLDQEATYFLGGSLESYQNFSAPFLLQYEAMMRTIKKGIPYYNFYGIEGEFDGSDGVMRFKQNFNGFILEKTGVFFYRPFPLYYKLTHSLKRIVFGLIPKK